jgi:DNA replication protein DnaC
MQGGYKMMADRLSIKYLTSNLASFGLKHVARELPDLLEQAAKSELTPKEFLYQLLETEAAGRNERRRRRNYAAAHFPPVVKTLEEFSVEELESGITGGQLRQLKEMTWADTFGNVMLAGPPGVGKTMIALGLCLHAVNEGYTVCIEKMDNFIKIIDKAPYERNAGFRLANMKKAQIICLDECGYTPIDRVQANNFFNFISDAYERRSIIITTNKSVDQWAEMMGDPVLTTALMDRLLHHAHCFSLKGTSYRLKHPEITYLNQVTL